MAIEQGKDLEKAWLSASDSDTNNVESGDHSEDFRSQKQMLRSIGLVSIKTNLSNSRKQLDSPQENKDPKTSKAQMQQNLTLTSTWNAMVKNCQGVNSTTTQNSFDASDSTESMDISNTSETHKKKKIFDNPTSESQKHFMAQVYTCPPSQQSSNKTLSGNKFTAPVTTEGKVNPVSLPKESMRFSIATSPHMSAPKVFLPKTTAKYPDPDMVIGIAEPHIRISERKRSSEVGDALDLTAKRKQSAETPPHSTKVPPEETKYEVMDLSVKVAMHDNDTILDKPLELTKRRHNLKVGIPSDDCLIDNEAPLNFSKPKQVMQHELVLPLSLDQSSSSSLVTTSAYVPCEDRTHENSKGANSPTVTSQMKLTKNNVYDLSNPITGSKSTSMTRFPLPAHCKTPTTPTTPKSLQTRFPLSCDLTQPMNSSSSPMLSVSSKTTPYAITSEKNSRCSNSIVSTNNSTQSFPPKSEVKYNLSYLPSSPSLKAGQVKSPSFPKELSPSQGYQPIEQSLNWTQSPHYVVSQSTEKSYRHPVPPDHVIASHTTTSSVGGALPANGYLHGPLVRVPAPQEVYIIQQPMEPLYVQRGVQSHYSTAPPPPVIHVDGGLQRMPAQIVLMPAHLVQNGQRPPLNQHPQPHRMVSPTLPPSSYVRHSGPPNVQVLKMGDGHQRVHEFPTGIRYIAHQPGSEDKMVISTTGQPQRDTRERHLYHPHLPQSQLPNLPQLQPFPNRQPPKP